MCGRGRNVAKPVLGPSFPRGTKVPVLCALSCRCTRWLRESRREGRGVCFWGRNLTGGKGNGREQRARVTGDTRDTSLISLQRGGRLPRPFLPMHHPACTNDARLFLRKGAPSFSHLFFSPLFFPRESLLLWFNHTLPRFRHPFAYGAVALSFSTIPLALLGKPAAPRP